MVCSLFATHSIISAIFKLHSLARSSLICNSILPASKRFWTESNTNCISISSFIKNRTYNRCFCIYNVCIRGACSVFKWECAGIAARGLQFTPILSLPELCFPFNVPDSLPQRILSLDEALACRWIFAFPSSETLYETEIAHQARKKGGFVIQPGTVESAAYGLPTLMLTPCIYHRRPSFDWVRMLRWGEGSRFGVVTAAAPDETVLRYIEEIRTVIRARQHQLFGILS